MDKQLLIDALPSLNSAITEFATKAESAQTCMIAAERLGFDLRIRMHHQNAQACIHTVHVWSAVLQVVKEKITELSAETELSVAE